MLNEADLTALAITLKLALFTTLILLSLGTPLAWWLARTRWRFKFLLEAVVAMPLVLPPTVLGFYLLVALGPHGPVGGLMAALGGRPLAFTFTGLVIGSESLLAHDMAALGWLLWNREYTTPEAYLSWYRDPYVTYPGFVNRLFIGQIWGIRELLKAETYETVPIHSVRSDPVLSRAASIWGGVPRLEMAVVKGKVPENVIQYIMDKATT